ncbi:unnamed protein product [Caenorhabditis angaria]|uniref:Uncharacterized protein n=1 Tax=Caenorhabditis angaria TaxID=860376 RepID=A0A9P1ILV2_9PELO|nr:unnamed protein product [Caenorhabditis angaria]
MSEKSFETAIKRLLQRFTDLPISRPSNLVDNVTMAQFKELAIKDTTSYMNVLTEVEEYVNEYKSILQMEKELKARKAKFFEKTQEVEKSLDNFEKSATEVKEKLEKHDYMFLKENIVKDEEKIPVSAKKPAAMFVEPTYSTRPIRNIEKEEEKKENQNQKMMTALDQSILTSNDIAIDEKSVARRLQFDDEDDDDDEIAKPTPKKLKESLNFQESPVFTSKYAQNLKK